MKYFPAFLVVNLSISNIRVSWQGHMLNGTPTMQLADARLHLKVQ
jgi:hypothetical protein